jgi:serine/arginine repetitive matrix protein 1
MPSIKGTSSVSDPRARSKALKATRFPKNFSKKVNLEKVNKAVLTQWVEQKVTSILGFDDEIVSSTAINLFLPSEGGNPDPRRAQLDLVGFLGEDESASFAKELWSLLLEAESSTSGIPRTLLEQKKKELSQQKISAMPPMMRPAQQQQQQPAAARHRNPEMNRFVQEAARRAQAARQIMMEGAPDGGPPAVREGDPVPIPVSPPSHPFDQQMQAQSSRATKTVPSCKGTADPSEDDRKMAPRDENRGRSDVPAGLPPLPRDSDHGPPRAHGGRNNEDSRSRRPYASRSSRSRSMDRGGDGGGGRRRDDDWRRSDDRRRDEMQNRDEDRMRRGGGGGPRDTRPRRYYDDDDEMEELERRLAVLKKRFIKRGNDRAIDEEMEDVKDRLYELERRRRRRRREREEEYRRRKRRDQRRSRSSDSDSDTDTRRRRGSRSPEAPPDRRRRSGSSDSDRSRRSASSESSVSSRSSSSSGSDDSYGRRRKEKSPSEEPKGQRKSPSEERKRKRSPSEERKTDRSRSGGRDDRRRRSSSHSDASSSADSYSDDSR